MGIVIPTPKGQIEVIERNHPTYPGVWIRVNGEDVVLVEHDDTIGKHVIRVWEEGEEEECSYKQIINECEVVS